MISDIMCCRSALALLPCSAHMPIMGSHGFPDGFITNVVDYLLHKFREHLAISLRFHVPISHI